MANPKTIIVDFETYYDDTYHLNTQRKGGLPYPAYITDKRFQAHGMAVDYGTTQDWVDDKDVPKWLKAHAGDILVAHNGFFDFGVMKWHYHFTPAYMVDTILMANHVLGSARDAGGGGNGLDELAGRLGLEAKGKQGFKGIRQLSEAERAAMIAYAKQDAKLARQVLNKLLPFFSNPEFEFWILDHTLRIYIDKPLSVDMEKIAKTKVLIDTRRVERLKAGGVAPTVLSSNKQFGEELAARLKAAKVKMPMKRGTKGNLIPALAKGDAAFLALAEHPNASVSDLVRARLVERSAAQALARLNTLEKHANLGIPVHLVYYGAHTGRFSAGGGFNFQNLTNPDRATDAVDREIAESIRGSIIPRPGNIFVASDAAQIEARGLAWLAGEQSILDDFASGADLYSRFISEVLEEDIHKPTDAEEHDNPALAKHLKLMRHVGKESVLGLGYQMGVEKFMFTLRSRNRDVAKLIDAGKITESMAKEIVTHYRNKYQAIVQFWEDLNKAFHKARNGITNRVGFLEFFRVERGAVGIVLPSGRTLYYRNIRSEARTDHKKRVPIFAAKADDKWAVEWKHGSGQRIYGGLLAENVTQAISRDVLAEGIFAAEQEGFPVAIHIHDEIVCEVPKAKGQEALDFLNKTLATPPVWAPGIVLGAEGKLGDNLGKKKAAA